MVNRSPGFAGRKVAPETNPGLPTKAKSENCATRYCLPPILNPAGARSPGTSAAFVALNESLDVVQLLITTSTGPLAVSAGASIFTCPGLTKSMNAALPLTVALTPSKVVGALLPLKSGPSQQPAFAIPRHAREDAARFEPFTSSHVPASKLENPPKSPAELTEV